MKKYILPLLLVIFPYLYFVSMFKLFDGSASRFAILAIVYLAIAVFIYLPNCVNAFLIQKKLTTYESVKLDFLVKLCLIPYYILFFMLSVVFVSLTFLFGGLFIAILFWLMDVALLVPSSLYGAAALAKAKKEGLITGKQQVLHTILHFLFCLDVVSAAVVFVKIRKIHKKRLCEQQESQNSEAEEENADEASEKD